MDRTKAAKVADALETIAHRDAHSDDLRATLTESAEMIRGLLKEVRTPLVGDEMLECKGYRIDVSEHTMRFVFFHKTGNPLAWLVANPEEAYEYATDILRNYDVLVGIAPAPTGRKEVARKDKL